MAQPPALAQSAKNVNDTNNWQSSYHKGLAEYILFEILNIILLGNGCISQPNLCICFSGQEVMRDRKGSEIWSTDRTLSHRFVPHNTSSSRPHFELCNFESLNSLKNSKRLSEECHQLSEILVFQYSHSCWQALRNSFRSQKSQDHSYLIFRNLHYLTSSTNS